ncbi:MAG: LysM domain/BON superfamily protein [Actinomycetia bacterium]|nr:LysM domain/BON superfamily protein [Actinomycetes bacterium]
MVPAMDQPERPPSMARLLGLQVLLVAMFPVSGWLATSALPLPTSVGEWWRADLVGVAAPVLWLAGFGLSLWLLCTSLAYVWATRRGHPGVRRITGRCIAPAMRRAIDAAVALSIGTAALAGPHAAFAASGPVPVRATGPSPSPSAPVVRSGSAASMPTTAAEAKSAQASPVVRSVPDLPAQAQAPAPTTRTGPRPTSAPASPTPRSVVSTTTAGTAPPVIRSGGATVRPMTTTTSPTAAAPTSTTVPRVTTTTATPSPTAPGDRNDAAPRSPDPSATAAPNGFAPIPVLVPVPAATPPAPAVATHHVIGAGESLWSIAAQHLRDATVVPARAVDEADVARYWARVVAVNRAALRSGNPSLVFPGEIVELPPVR